MYSLEELLAWLLDASEMLQASWILRQDLKTWGWYEQHEYYLVFTSRLCSHDLSQVGRSARSESTVRERGHSQYQDEHPQCSYIVFSEAS